MDICKRLTELSPAERVTVLAASLRPLYAARATPSVDLISKSSFDTPSIRAVVTSSSMLQMILISKSLEYPLAITMEGV